MALTILRHIVRVRFNVWIFTSCDLCASRLAIKIFNAQIPNHIFLFFAQSIKKAGCIIDLYSKLVSFLFHRLHSCVLLWGFESFCRGSIVLKLYPIQERPSSKVTFWFWLCLIISYRPLKEIWWRGALKHFNGQDVFCSSSDLHCLLLHLSRGAPQAHAHLPCKYKRIKYKPNLLK